MPAPEPAPTPADAPEGTGRKTRTAAVLVASVEPLLLTADQAAELLGISPATLYRMRSAGKLPLPVRLGGSVRWSRETLVEWIRMDCPPLKEFSARLAAKNASGRK
jgi:excisionase family DNA binding protein